MKGGESRCTLVNAGEIKVRRKFWTFSTFEKYIIES